MNHSTGPHRHASIEPYIHRKLVYVSQDTPVSQVARILCDSESGSCLFHDGQGHLTGILTDRDIVCDALAHEESLTLPAARFMKTRLVTLDEHALVSDAVDKMEQYGIRRIPVVRRREGHIEATGAPTQKVVGILSLDDLIAANAIESTRLARIIQRQLHHSFSSREGRTVRYIRARDGSYHALTTQNTLDGPKTKAHVEQTWVRFQKHISKQTGIAPDKVAESSRIILQALMRRVPWSVASHFISQLPRTLQKLLEDIPAGPDRNITIESTIPKLSRLLQLTDAETDRVFHRYVYALGDFVAIEAIHQLGNQLPIEFKKYFPPEREPYQAEAESVLLPPQTEEMEPTSELEPVRSGHPSEGERVPPARSA
jgi:CBS domain-containing protein/uncharacterized protein (DUF2267 family)